MRCLLLYLSAVSADDPKRPAGAGASAGFVQNDGQIPYFLTTPVTGGISHEDLSILNAPQHDKMSRLREMPFGHQSHDQLPVCQGIQNALWFRSGTPFNGKPPTPVLRRGSGYGRSRFCCTNSHAHRPTVPFGPGQPSHWSARKPQ